MPGDDHIDSNRHDISDRNSEIDESIQIDPETGKEIKASDIATFEQLTSSLSSLSDALLLHAEINLLEEELQATQNHLNKQEFRIAAVRLNALFETYIEYLLFSKIEDNEGQLTEADKEDVRGLGHEDRIKRAKQEGIVGKHAKGAINALRQVRKEPAHVAWTDVEISHNLTNHTTHAHNQLRDHIAHLNEHRRRGYSDG